VIFEDKVGDKSVEKFDLKVAGIRANTGIHGIFQSFFSGGVDYREVKKTCNEETLLLETHLGNVEPNSDNELTRNFTKAPVTVFRVGSDLDRG